MRTRRLALILAVVLMAVLAYPAYSADLSDVDGHWGQEFIEQLVSRNIINGYPDGTFRPDGTITRAEFTVLLLKAKDIEPMNASGDHWASGWLQSAMDQGYVKSGEFTDLDRNITRGEIALLIDRALEQRGDYYMARARDVKDASTLETELKEAVLNVFDTGIVSGYGDGTFRVDRSATRAEAATMITRLLLDEYRKEPTLIFNSETLALFDGKNGMAPLVAVDDNVYDMSGISSWAGGEHYGGAKAGMDVTEIFEQSHHSINILLKAKRVGRYIDE